MASTNTEGEPTAASAEGEPACMHAFVCVCVCVFVCASERVYVSVFECKWLQPTQRVSRQRRMLRESLRACMHLCVCVCVCVCVCKRARICQCV